MTDEELKKKALAAGKVALGVGRIASGIVTATGHGLVGGFLKSHHMTQAAVRLGKAGVEGGAKMVKEGMKEFD